MAASFFLFAHQDDEFGVFQKIVDESSYGRKVYCAYLTDGVPIGHSPAKRNQESISVLMNLGVPRENILFIGEKLSIPDGMLVDNLHKARNWLSGLLSETSNIGNIYLPAWEGGHPDHDSLHAIGVMVAKELNLLDFVWQYPLYNGYQCKGQLFCVLLPIPSNSEILSKKITWRNRCRFLGLMLSYPSQAVTWIGLMPSVIFHYVFFGTQSLQRVSPLNILHPPHAGHLYYERRKFCTWKKMSEKIKELYYN